MATLGTFTAGQVLTAAELNAIGTWTTFTPTIVGISGGSVTIGNGTLSGTYVEINDLVVANYTLVWGSTTTTNTSGLWLFSTPVGSSNSGHAAGRILDAGNTYHRVTGLSSTNKLILQATDTGSEVQNTVPMTWANGDVMTCTYVYKAS